MDFSFKKFGQRQNFIYLCNRKIKRLQYLSIDFSSFLILHNIEYSVTIYYLIFNLLPVA